MNRTYPSAHKAQPLYCVVHCRVSTPKQAYQGESLDTQASICTAIVNTRGWLLAHDPWKESFSGRKNQRPVFEEILAFIDQHPGRVKYYLFRTIDRMTRGGSFTYEQMKRELERRGVELIDSLGIIQPTTNTLAHLGFEYKWSKFSPSKISELVVATAAETEITTILTRLIGEEISLRQQGYKVRHAADGFVNTRIIVGGKKRVVELPDPDRAKYLIAMFELRASGQFIDREICDRVNAMGYRGRGFNRWSEDRTEVIRRVEGQPLTVKRLQALIVRPIYCGIICEKWTRWLPIKAAYDGLVSIETFNAANRGQIAIRQRSDTEFEMIKGGDQSHKGRRLQHSELFPFRRVVLCPLCQKPFVGSSPRGKSGGRFPTYHCARNHKYLGVPKATFERNLRSYIESLKFRTGMLPDIREYILSAFEDEKTVVEAAVRDTRRTVAELECRRADAIKSFKFATTDAMRRGLEEEVTNVERELEETRFVETGLEIGENDIDAYIAEMKGIMEHPTLLLENPVNPAQLESLYTSTFDGLPTYAEIANGTPKLAWIFSLSLDFEKSKSLLVSPHGLKWNTIQGSVLKWKKAREDHPSPFLSTDAKNSAKRRKRN